MKTTDIYMIYSPHISYIHINMAHIKNKKIEVHLSYNVKKKVKTMKKEQPVIKTRPYSLNKHNEGRFF